MSATSRTPAASQLPHLMTVATFLDWTTPDGSDRWELVDGIPRAMAPPGNRHALIHGEAGRLIGNHLAEHRPECRIAVGAGLRPGEFNVRIPDLAVTCEPVLPSDRLLREPVLIVEILSPSNAADTWANVALYATMPSVLEILVLHTDGIIAELLRRGSDGSWPESPVMLEAGDSVELRSIGHTVPAAPGPGLAAFYRTAGV